MPLRNYLKRWFDKLTTNIVFPVRGELVEGRWIKAFGFEIVSKGSVYQLLSRFPLPR